MSPLEVLGVALFVVSAAGVLAVFVAYPLVLVVAGGARGEAPPAPASPSRRTVSFLIAVRNGEALVEEKARNCLAQEGCERPQVVFVSDGSTDATVARLAALRDAVEVLEIREHRGKAHALNQGVERCHGEILVLSDADALLAPDALRWLLARFEDPSVGGVSGRRVIADAGGGLSGAQGHYIAADSALKRAESRLGSTTANDGKLYAVRRALFRPIAEGATDDLFTCLTVVAQGRRFVFEPRARAAIRTPSRGARHELSRRRRIVARSLRGIALQRALLVPWRSGVFALQLLVNKVLRRLLPLFLLGLLVSSALLAPLPAHWIARLALAAQGAFYALALLRVVPGVRRVPGLGPACDTAFYFCIGNLGTLLGLADFLRGKETVRWEPRKSG